MLPTRVLPSNAPPLDGDGLLAGRVLQEHSGNRQHNAYPYTTEYAQKFPTSLLTENAYALRHQAPRHRVPQQLYHPRPHHNQAWKWGYTRNGYGPNTPEEEAKNQVEAEYLYRRFRQSDPYVKYRNRQQKEDKGNEDQRWPDHLEKAFFHALVTWKPMGRRKILHKDKQRGRNELIADRIQELTGEVRSRKQVSSHIQVLKPFVELDPYIMKFLSKEDLCAHHGRNGHASAYGGGRRMSGYPVTSLPHSVRGSMPSLPRTNNYNIAKLKHNPDVFEPVEFEMFVQQTFKDPIAKQDTRDPIRLFTYTRSGRSDVPPRDQDLYMDDWQRIERDFPLLATMNNNQGKLDCNVVAAEATLAFPTETFKGHNGGAIPGIELGIKFKCSSRHLPPAPKEGSSPVYCTNTFYLNGVVSTEKENPQTAEVRFERNNDHRDTLETQIKFGSNFWARNLGQMASRLLNPAKDYSEEVAAQIRSITGIQEVFIATERKPERLLVIHWTFRQSTKSEGAARWRRLILPTATHQPSLPDAGIKPDDHPKVERSDSLLDCYSQYMEMPASQPQQQLPLPALQSPFEYDSSSGSALSSATWPTSTTEGSVIGQNGHFDFSADNAFDFNADNIDISYDHNFNFGALDSSAFDFGTGTTDFAADPTLEDYTQAWVDPTATAAFDIQPNSAVEETATFMSLPPEFQSPIAVYDQAYDTQYSQHSYPGLPEHHSFQDTPHDQQVYDQQAFGGAG